MEFARRPGALIEPPEVPSSVPGAAEVVRPEVPEDAVPVEEVELPMDGKALVARPDTRDTLVIITRTKQYFGVYFQLDDCLVISVSFLAGQGKM